MRSAEEFLRGHTALDLETAHKEIITILETSTLHDAFKVMRKNSIHSVPIVSKDGGCLGMFSWIDAVEVLVEEFKKSKGLKDKEFARKFWSHPLVNVANKSGRNPLIEVPHDTSLWEINELLFPHGRDARAQRVVAVKDGRAVKVVSRSAIVRALTKNLDSFEKKIGATTVGTVKLGYRTIKAVKPSTPAIEAFVTMSAKKISSVALLDDGGALLSNISSSDLAGIDEDFANLSLTALDFMTSVRQKSIKDIFPSVSVTPDDTIGRAMGMITATKMHRLYVTEKSGKAIGIIGLQDILHYVLRSSLH